MSALNEPIAKRIATLFRMLDSNFDGEVLGAVAAMKRLFKAERLTFHDIATVIESCNGEIEERKYSDADAEIIFKRGLEKGRTEEARKREAPPEFYNADGQPRWYEIAMYCQQNSAQLNEWERNFANDMPGKIIKYGAPTKNQIPHLLAIFVRLGGYYDPKTAHLRR
ncbi:MAG: hypothetical protein WB689_09315 [Xanthobacteraceae bacterium]